jgi:DNA-directed RNA polymerase specialized sigma24 family protein
MKTTLTRLAAAACTQQSTIPAPETILTPALKIALAQYALRYIYPQRQFVPALEWQLQQVYLRKTVQNCRYLQALARAEASEQAQFLQAALSPLPSAITLSATPRLMAQEVVNSIFSGKRFTSIIASHDPNGDASLRTWLTKRIYWKIFPHLRREQRSYLREITLNTPEPLLTEDEFAQLEQDPANGESAPSAEELASDNEMIASSWARFDTLLTEREQQVMLCYLNGMSNEAGCQHMATHVCPISLATYKRDKKAALEKLKMPDLLHP